MWHPIAFITTPIDVSVELPVQIGDNLLLRKAKNDEIRIIKHYVSPSFAGGMMNQNPYEQYYKFKNNSKSVATLSNLDVADFRYFVVELKNIGGLNLLNENPIDILQIASDLTKSELKFDLTIFLPKIATIKHNSLHKQTNGLKYGLFDHYDFTLSDIEELKQNYNLVSKQYLKDEFLTRALSNFRLLQETPDYYSYLNLNLFALLEMLVTSRPGINTPSIINQLKTKTKRILDLENFKLSFEEVFIETNENHIWNKLYDYRSCLAHGSFVNFEKELKKLKSEEVVFDFLKNLLKKLLKIFLLQKENALEIKKDLKLS